MLGWLRRCVVGFFGYWDVIARLDDIERRFHDLEMEWSNREDKMIAMMRRHQKRMVDAAGAIEAENPSRTDVRLDRAARKAKLRERRMHGGTLGSVQP